jgi:hypothetical protein
VAGLTLNLDFAGLDIDIGWPCHTPSLDAAPGRHKRHVAVAFGAGSVHHCDPL